MSETLLSVAAMAKAPEVPKIRAVKKRTTFFIVGVWFCACACACVRLGVHPSERGPRRPSWTSSCDQIALFRDAEGKTALDLAAKPGRGFMHNGMMSSTPRDGVPFRWVANRDNFRTCKEQL